MRLNKYFIAFTGLFAAVSFMMVVAALKYFPLLLHQTIYYCKEMAETLAFRFPGGIGIILFSILSIILTYTLIKSIATGLAIYRFRKGLQQNSIDNARFATLFSKL